MKKMNKKEMLEFGRKFYLLSPEWSDESVIEFVKDVIKQKKEIDKKIEKQVAKG